MYDPERRTGTLLNAVNYRRRARKPKKSIAPIVDLDELEMKKVDKFFRTCVLPKDRKELEENLLKFKDYRQGLIKDDFERYMTMWDFYFVDVDLVSLIQLINSRRTIYKNSLNFRFRLTMVLFLVQTIN